MDKISNDVRVYTDVQGLEQLRGELKSNPGAVKKEMAMITDLLRGEKTT